MSKVYQCDRCKAIGEIRESDEDKRFSIVNINNGRDIHLCRHCTLKLEDFLSDPNCMETIEEEDMGEEGR